MDLARREGSPKTPLPARFKLHLRFGPGMRFHRDMKNLIRSALLLAALCAAALCVSDATALVKSLARIDELIYIGTNTGGKSQGIYVFKLSMSTGQLTPLGLAAPSNSPAFLAVDPTHRYLYAVNEVGDYQGGKTGSVSAFVINHRTGKLTLLNTVDSGGAGPTHLVVDKSGKYVLVANYGAGSVALFPILSGGSLGKARLVLPHTGHSVDPGRQKEPHAHSIYVSPDNHFAVSADLGTDQIYVYRFDAAKGTLTPNNPPTVAVAPGSGPRHFAFDPHGRFGYVIQEMASTITAFSYDAAHGRLTQIQDVSTLPPGYKSESDCAEIFVHPFGKFLYGSNRGHDSIAVFAIDPVKGTLTPVETDSTQGKTPRSFGMDPTGHYLIAANQDSDSIVLFRIDGDTGHLTPVGTKLDVPSPTCVLFEPVQY